MIREALSLGYDLVPYETKNTSYQGTKRDYDQAQNILNKTDLNKGKVIVHAGYSHISETGDRNFYPMGYHLSKMADQDVLTVDQIVMYETIGEVKSNSYYDFANDQYTFNSASVFLNKRGKSLVDPVNSLGIDIQIYHLPVKFNYDRPEWLKNEDNFYFEIPEEFNAEIGDLIRVYKPEEYGREALPVDQFVIRSESSRFILKEGSYKVEVIDCEGTLLQLTDIVIG